MSCELRELGLPGDCGKAGVEPLEEDGRRQGVTSRWLPGMEAGLNTLLTWLLAGSVEPRSALWNARSPLSHIAADRTSRCRTLLNS